MSTNSIENETEKGDHVVEQQEELDPADYSMKHPLQNVWTLWYYEYNKSQEWADNLKKIASFSTVEDFWSLYNHIKYASELKQGCDYALFKEDIKPMWEDAANRNGGRWLINLDRRQRGNDLDRYWLDILLCLIGEAFENSDDVHGAVVNVRARGDKISIWVKDNNRKDAVLEIGNKIKDRLRIMPKNTIGYYSHSQQEKNPKPILSV